MSSRQAFMLSFRAFLLVSMVLVALAGVDQLSRGSALQGLATFAPAVAGLAFTLLVLERRSALRPWLGIAWAVVFALTVLGLVAASGEQISPDQLGYSLLGVLVATSRDRVAGTLNGAMAAAAFTYLAWTYRLAEPLSVYVLSVDAVFLGTGAFTGFLSRESEQEREEAAEHQEALREQLADMAVHLRDVLASVASGVLVIDHEQTVSTYNRTAQRLLGVPEHRVIGRRLADVEPLQQLQAAFTQVAFNDTESGSGVGDLQNRHDLDYRRPDGARLRIGYSLTALEDVAARRKGSILVFQDVTLIRDYEARLLAQEKLAALGRLVSGIAHEFGNQLGGARGHVDLALATGDPADAQDALPIVRDTLAHALETVEHLLRFARGTPLNRVPGVRPADVVEQALLLLSVELDKQAVQVERDFAETPTVTADPAQLQQVFVNLIINAIHAVADQPERRIHVAIARGAEGVELRFSDNGPGIPAELRDRVFEPFFTTKGSLGGSGTPGTGLGLASCLGIVEGHDGRLTLDESAVLPGACLVVQLPADEPPSTIGDGA